MRKFIIALIFLFPLIVMAQGGRGGGNYSNFGKKKSTNHFRGNISGKIIDLNNKKGLEYANVTLKNTKWDKVIEGTITDSKGKFTISNILSGKYTLVVSYLGYKKKEVEFELTKRNPDIRLQNIELEKSSEILSEVTIEEEKAIYESRIDKIVYNVENDVNQGTDDATDVLRKAPLLTVDFEGNVELRGSKDIKFLLNGKASSFLKGDLSTALSMIPADEIKSVEVITSPGAKYDGEGEAGIVNIITKKSIIDGYKATIDGSVGTRINRNSYSITLGKGRFSLSGRGGANYSWPREGITKYKREDWNNSGDTNVLTNNGISKSQWIQYRGGVNMFYDINAYNSISSDINFSARHTPTYNTTNYDYTGTFPNDTVYNYESRIDSERDTRKLQWNLDYTRTFDEPEKELSMSFQIGARLNDEETDISEQNDQIRLTNLNNEKNIDQTFQIDYTHPINIHKIELGAKIINRNQEMNYSTTSDDSNYILPEELFNYNQLVGATYLSTQWELPNDFGLLGGLRYEFTQINGDWENNTNNPFDDSYHNILPNLTLSKNLDLGKDIKLSYNTRISRPSSQYINTNTDISDNKNITIGNPDLIPSTTQQFELGYNSFGRKYQGSYYIYYKNSKDLIESFLTVRNDTSITTFENVGSSVRYGLNYYGSIKFEKITLRAGFNLGSYESEDNRFTTEKTKASTYSYNFGGTYDLGKKWKAETWGFYRSASQTIQGSSTSFGMMSLGLKKEFKNKRGSLGIRVVEPFLKDGYKVFKTNLSGPNFNQESKRKILFTSIGISFKYTFGKLNFKSSKQRNKIKNDDVQEERESEF